MKKIESYILFKCGTQLFAMTVDYIRNILELPRIFPVPQAPPYVQGVINVDGEVVPLINTGIKLGMESTMPGDQTAVIVLERTHEGKSQRLSLLVDEVVEVVDLNPFDLQPLPTSKFEFDERLVDGAFKISDDFAMQINTDNFFKHNLDEILLQNQTL
jgi:purine-binding chemotaxis protein CheW